MLMGTSVLDIIQLTGMHSFEINKDRTTADFQQLGRTLVKKRDLSFSSYFSPIFFLFILKTPKDDID